MSNEADLLQDATRAQLDQVSQALLRLHKSMLDDERIIYEAAHGPVSPNDLFRLALGHSQFTWLGKLLSLIAQLDEAASVRRPATETKAQSLLHDAVALLQMTNGDQVFQERFQDALQRSTEAQAIYEETLQVVIVESE